MSNQEQEISEPIVSSETSQSQTTVEIQVPNSDEKSSSSENKTAQDSPIINEQEKPRRIVMAQDIRYATEHDDRKKLMEKYNHYQVSDINACHLRFLTDHRQKKNLFGRNEEDNSNLHAIAKTFDVNILPGYQNTTKHSFKLLGKEVNIQKCLVEVMNRMFNYANRSTVQDDSERNNHQQANMTPKVENPQGTEDSPSVNATEEKSPSHPTSIFVTTINPDSSITEEKKPITPSTPTINEEKADHHDEHPEEEKIKFVPLERKPEYSFTMLITSQGQEVLKKNWSFFGGSLQQRLNVIVTNPFKLPKFGEKQWQNELSITGERIENITDAVLQVTAFINDVLGIPLQPYNADEEQTSGDHNTHHRIKSNHNNDYVQPRRHDYNNAYRQSPSQHQGQSSPYNNYHERTFFNRGRQGVYEQIILIRSNCVARIVGTRGSNLRRIQAKCHLRDMIVARHANENGYVECTLSAYQTRNLNFAIDTIHSYLRNEDDQAIQVLESHYVDLPLQSSPFQNSPHNDQPQLTAPNQTHEHFQQQAFPNTRYQQQQQMSFTAPPESRHTHREPGFMTRPLHFGNGKQLPQPSYNFQNTPSFDFTHRPTSASRKMDKRPGEGTECNSTTNGQVRTPNDCHDQHYTGSSSSNSSSVSPRHKSKRACPETKEIDCTTDDGFWIQKQYYHALDDSSKELFDSLLETLEKIRIVTEENAVRKQQRLVGRNRSNKTRGFPPSMSSNNPVNDDNIPPINEKESINKTNEDEHETKVEQSTNEDEQQENEKYNTTEQETTTVAVEQS